MRPPFRRGSKKGLAFRGLATDHLWKGRFRRGRALASDLLRAGAPQACHTRSPIGSNVISFDGVIHNV